MNNKELIRNIVIIVILVSIATYGGILLYNISTIKSEMTIVEDSINKIKKKIKKEVNNQKILKETDTKYIENAYFDRSENYLENYFRAIFDKYNINFTIYQSTMSEKDYSEIGVNFIVNAFDFFKLIKDIEEGRHLFVIRSLDIKKDQDYYFKVSMKLRGYYKK